MALSASSPRRMASSLSNNVTPRPLPLSRLTSIIIFAPSSPAGVSPDSTSERTMSIAASTLPGSLSNVATRAYISPPRVSRTRASLRRTARRLLAAVRFGGALGHRDRELRRLLAHGGVVDLGDPVDQLEPLVGLEHRGHPPGGLRVGAIDRAEPDVDVVGVVAHRERVVGAFERHQRDDLVRLHRALERQQALDRQV